MAKSIKVNLDLLLVQRKKSLTELSEEVGITMANLSTLKRGKGKAIRFSTLLALCEALDCEPGDLLQLEDIE
ncbi:helix-turn-helix transcriptional regulator [Pleionea sp. CnH1-48]|uniref:helix-turn-helix domain-containing protein n=1 Tax=Pleionea sp. CnH1-48 TaxID=2954494 RepID=UPI002097424B|nr:helix-turn-helix transcriptional regulator [Pleionea sp. CnH1-48]MCO7225567.1 helix-turn-helix transcriptional regulator [Pleionea sp. CnH1-48]